MPRPMNRLGSLLATAVLLLSSLLLGTLGLAAPAHAGGSVTVDNGGRGAVVDSTYSSRITVSGRGFQSIKGGHGGVYVWFGTVNGNWRPSQGGKSGVNYLYVPDSETKGNQGFQRYVAFPGSDTASSANGGSMSASGAWRVELLVPGPTFQAVGRNGTVQTVDCRKVTCGVITVGAHGVHNANNETFTPVRLADLQPTGGSQPTQPSTPGTGSGEQGGQVVVPGAGTSDQPGTVTPDVRRGKPKLEVDRASAVAGRGLSFVAQNFTAGSQITLVLDDGVVASGPHVIGSDGTVAGVLQLPDDLRAGTHELRTFSAGRVATVKFGVLAGEPPAAPTQQATESAQPSTAAVAFVAGSAALFVVALVVSVRRWGRGRRAGA